MAVNLSPIWGAGAQLLDNSGNVLTGGKIYTYLAGTTTPATTYTSSNGVTANSNPIILNSAGRVPYEIWLTEAVARGRISAPGFLTDPILRQAYLGSEWIGPSQGQLDPTKEVQAAVMAIENGLSTREAEAVKLNGSQYSTNADKLAVENEHLRAANGGNQPAAAPAAPEPPPDEDDKEE